MAERLSPAAQAQLIIAKDRPPRQGPALSCCGGRGRRPGPADGTRAPLALSEVRFPFVGDSCPLRPPRNATNASVCTRSRGQLRP